LNVQEIIVGELETNCYILWDIARSHVLVVDPGAQPEKIIETLDKLGLSPTEIVLTHSHYDHIGAIPALKSRYGILVAIHKSDAPNLESPQANFSALFMENIAFKADKTLVEGDKWQFDKSELSVLYTPGHSEGSISLAAKGLVLSGDTIFKSGIGRTDLPGGNYSQIVKSVKRLLGFRDLTKVYPGHGPRTTIGDERIFLTGL